MSDDVLIWDRHSGGHARCGPVRVSLPMLRQPVLLPLSLESIDYRPGVCALVREHACAQREMTRAEMVQCDLYLRSVGSGGVR